MYLRYSLCVAFCISLVPLSVHAAPKTGGSVAKADQDVIRQAAKAGLSAQQVRDLSAAMKKDNTIGQAVKGAIDTGSRGPELAAFVQSEITKRQGMMGQGQGMGQGMGANGSGMGMSMGQGMGMNGGGMGMMGQGMGMNGGGMGMMGGRSMGMNGGGMGMMGGRGMGMGRGMRGGR